jgi:hypothetical protein
MPSCHPLNWFGNLFTTTRPVQWRPQGLEGDHGTADR